MKKRLWLIFLVVSNVTNLKARFVRVKKYYDNYCGRFRIISLTSRRFLKRQTSEKKTTIPVKKNLTIFSRKIEYEKPHGVFCGGRQRLLATIVQVIRPFFRDLRGFGNTIFWKENGKLSSEEKFWPIFLVLSSVTNFWEHFSRVKKVI